MNIIDRLLPAQADNSFGGHRAAPWLLGIFVALKIVMGMNSILNTEAVAGGADGIALASFEPAAAREVLTLFALTSLGQLTLALVALAVLLRYRTLLPLMYLVLIGEALARCLIVQSHSLVRTEAAASVGTYINLGILALLILGLVLSMTASRRATGGNHSQG